MRARGLRSIAMVACFGAAIAGGGARGATMVPIDGRFSGNFASTMAATSSLESHLHFVGNTGLGAANTLGPANIAFDAFLTLDGAIGCEAFTNALVTLSNASADSITLRATGKQCYRPAGHYTSYHLDKQTVPVAVSSPLPQTVGPIDTDPIAQPSMFLDGTATFDVVGGGGRFAGATGSGKFSWLGEIRHFGVAASDGVFEPFTLEGVVSEPSAV